MLTSARLGLRFAFLQGIVVSCSQKEKIAMRCRRDVFRSFVVAVAVFSGVSAAQAEDLTGKLVVESVTAYSTDDTREIIDGEEFGFTVDDEGEWTGASWRIHASFKNESTTAAEVWIGVSNKCVSMYVEDDEGNGAGARQTVMMLAPGQRASISFRATHFGSSSRSGYLGLNCFGYGWIKVRNADGSFTVYDRKRSNDFHLRTLTRRCGQETVSPELFPERGDDSIVRVSFNYNRRGIIDYYDVFPIPKRCREDYVIPNYLDVVLDTSKGKGRK